ncbi:MAG: acyloxyacyl hydrolase [Terriglobia bacterium]
MDAALPAWVGLQALLAAAQLPALPLPPQLSGAPPSRTGSPSGQGSTEWSWTSGAGARIAGGAREGDFWAMQLRWGRILTEPRGPGWLRGTFEYAFEAVPALVMVQSETVFGGGFSPLVLQYNFTSSQRFVPFAQAGGGMLFTTDEVPAGTTQFNFTPQGGVGAYWLRGERASLVLGVRYHHISNAGRVQPNPGHNALYFYGGMSWWR